jgi:ABC-type multidrug transport system ATPase subunit
MTTPSTSAATAAPREGADDHSGTPVLSAVGIDKAYRRFGRQRRRAQVLVGADIDLYPGEVVGLVGENGSGKSTLMKVLVGAHPPDAGTVVTRGQIGYCPQEPLVYGRLTCDEHIELFARAYRMSDGDARRSRDDLYAALNFARFARVRADRLSGGTLSKLNLALALLPDPDVLLLDEPYAGFDWDTYLRFWDLVEARRTRGKSVLVISHFVVDEHRFTRIVDLRDGRTWPR